MAFNPKKREDFIESLKNIQINRPPEEDFIKKFSPEGLSSLYELFMQLKDKPISNTQYNYLRNIISSHYSDDISNLVCNPITDTEINQLLEMIKQEYIQLVNENNPKNISKQEEDSLKNIVNTHFPEVFLDFIKTPVSNKEFSEQTQLIKDAVHNLISLYYQQTTPHSQKNSDYLASAIYLVFRTLYPELSITVPKREKGEKSFNDNTHKELNNSIKNIVPSNVKTGITLSDLETQINSNEKNKNNFTDKADADISGITIVLNHFDDAIYFDENDPENLEILRLKKQRNDNVRFIHSIKKYLNENDIFMTQEEYFQIYIELLHRLQDTTYPECTHEIKEGSYSSRLEYAIENYKKNVEANSFAVNATDAEIEELYNLTDCLKRRIDDKLEHEILKVSFPHVLDDFLLADDFKITGTFVKDVKKENGFCAIYYELTDALGRKTEVQLQSNMRYKETKNGLSTHNDMPSKQVNINHFFELVDKNETPELLEHYLSILHRTSRKQEEELKQKLKSLNEQKTYTTKSPEEKRKIENSIRRLEKKIETIETAKNSVKIKDVFIEEVEMIDTENNTKDNDYEIININGKPVKVYETKTKKRIDKMTIEQYLPVYAEHIAPTTMKVVGSAHATAPEAHINKKSLVEGFTEVLRKGDEIPYLSQFLIDKLKEILNSKENDQISLEDLKKYAREEFYSTPDER